MTMTMEKHLKDFNFWGGAATNAAKLTTEELDTLEAYLDSISYDAPMSITEVNDCLWFSFEDVCVWLRLDYEEVMARS